MNNIKLFFLLGVLLYSCKQPESDWEKLKSYYQTHKKSKPFESFKRIIVFNELGGCLNCSSHYSIKMKQYKKDLSVLFITSTTGSKYDISLFIDTLQPNIIWDYNKDFDKLNIMPKSGEIKLNHQSKTISKRTIEISDFK